MIYHIIATLIGFILDLILGDPQNLPHPIRLIGAWISLLEKCLIGKKGQKQIVKGILLVILVLLLTVLLSGVCLWTAYDLHPIVGCLIEGIMTYQILAMRCLGDESMKVYHRLQEGDLKAARAAVSMIVGRDTLTLDRAGIIRAAVETVAENTSDGVIAPLLYTALGGPILGFLYKAVNNVCERAAMKAAGEDGQLILKKQAEDGMTIAVARKKWTFDSRHQEGIVIEEV